MYQGKGMKANRKYLPVCKSSPLCDIYLWWPAWWELTGHKCPERALPAIVIHPLKSQTAQRSAVCITWVKKFGYGYTEVPTLNPAAFYCIRSQ